jgi:serine/threonine-protein kinase RsbW
MGEHVDLDLPLSARYATTVRSVAASVAAALGMSIDDIDDLRLGVNEAISVLTDVDDDVRDAGGGRLHVRFETEPGRIAVTAHRTGVSATASVAEIDILARRILSAVVDEFSVDEDGAILLVKQVPVDADT